MEAAKARFLKNFGSELCESCDGLKAGPGVAATCFQVRQCFFGNIKETVTSPRQTQVIKTLLKGTDTA